MHGGLAHAAERRADHEDISFEKAYQKEYREELATAKREAMTPGKDLDKIKRWFGEN